MRAAQTIDGAMTGKKFLAYVEKCLAPTLSTIDNHRAAVRQIDCAEHQDPRRTSAGTIAKSGLSNGSATAEGHTTKMRLSRRRIAKRIFFDLGIWQG
jgi:hypothetical protein